MDLNKHIKDNYGTRYKFAKDNNIEIQSVYYWCSKEWDRLSFNTREKIKGYVDKNTNNNNVK